jgi:hypothetical protein
MTNDEGISSAGPSERPQYQLLVWRRREGAISCPHSDRSGVGLFGLDSKEAEMSRAWPERQRPSAIEDEAAWSRVP